MKTSELTGAALDWAVAKCEHEGAARAWLETWKLGGDRRFVQEIINSPSANWAQGGPIIEREHINVSYEGHDIWLAGGFNGVCYLMGHGGPTPLIAAMRCYVASKLGDEVKIPEELI